MIKKLLIIILFSISSATACGMPTKKNKWYHKTYHVVKVVVKKAIKFVLLIKFNNYISK